jgi:alpha-glucosidase (family GH31 glycosyl hydrolase)
MAECKKIFLLPIIIILLNSCSVENNSVYIISKSESGFPEIVIANDYGNDFRISPSNNTGSVGYELNNKTYWVTGQPEKESKEAGITLFKWNNAEHPVELMVKTGDKTANLTFSLTSEGQPTKWLVNSEAASDEFFTGVFERVVDGPQSKSWAGGITTGLDLRGEKMDVKLKPTVSAYAPFYLSSENFAVFVHGTWPGVFDFCKETDNIVQMAFEGPTLAFTVMKDENPARLVQRHAMETGPSIVPPKWALGPWRWRDEHFQNDKYFDGSPVNSPYNSDLTEDILMMEAYGIPCTAYWIDRPWGPGVRGFDDYEVDKERLPNFEKMIAWLNKKEIELMLWIGPFVMGNMADVAEERNYHLKSHEWKNSRQVLMDFTNPEATEWWGKNGPGKLAEMGIKGFKMDRADGEKLMDSLHLKTYAGTTYRENFNNYPVQYVKAAYDAVQPVLGDDFLLFPRAQYTGSAKYGGMWAGDTGGVPEGLRSAVIGMQRCAVMGYPVWGSDVGGYWGGFSRDATKRWLGFGCFSPLMEVGPTQNRGFWNLENNPNFDAELIATWRLYARLRMHLIDYIHHLTQLSNETGMPVARPLFLEYPNQQEAWKDYLTYKFGPDLLVSVNWEEGSTQHKMFLPAGETWLNLWEDGKEYEGGQFIELNLPASKTPVFLKKGSNLELPNLNELWEESLEVASQKFSLSDLEATESWE